MRRISSVFFRKHFGGGKQTKVLMFWSILSTGAGTVVIFMFRGHVSACLKVSWSSCGCLEKNATHFLLKYAPCTSKCVGFSHPKKKHPMIPMVLPNHGHVFRGLEPPTEADPNFDVAGEPTCKAKTINTAVTIPPQTNSSPLKNGGWETTFLLGRPMFRGYVTVLLG